MMEMNNNNQYEVLYDKELHLEINKKKAKTKDIGRT